jgi:hypothetical protein
MDDLGVYYSVSITAEGSIVRLTNKFTAAMRDQCINKYGRDLSKSEHGKLLMVNEWNRLAAACITENKGPYYHYYI